MGGARSRSPIRSARTITVHDHAQSLCASFVSSALLPDVRFSRRIQPVAASRPKAVASGNSRPGLAKVKLSASALLPWQVVIPAVVIFAFSTSAPPSFFPLLRYRFIVDRAQVSGFGSRASGFSPLTLDTVSLPRRIAASSAPTTMSAAILYAGSLYEPEAWSITPSA